MSHEPPRLATWLLQRCLPRDVVGASILGDLREEYARDPDPLHRDRRYTRAALGLATRYAAGRAKDALLLRRRGRAVTSEIRTPPTRSRPMLHVILEDCRDAWRGLRRRPLFALASVGLLACGLGASSTIFSFVEAVWWQPVPGLSAPDRVVRITERRAEPRPGQAPYVNLTVPDMHHLAAAVPSLAAATAMLDGAEIPFSGPDGGVRIPSHRVTSGFFGVVGVSPFLGRAFTPDDERPGAAPVVILSHGAWQRWFGGAPSALGARLTLNYQAHTVVGVMPPGFAFPSPADVLVPMTSSTFTSRFHIATVLARVRAGVPLERAQAEIDAVMTRRAAEDPGGDHEAGARVVSWRVAATERVRPALRILMTAAILVLALATVNLGGLLTERTSGRMSELAIRRSLGATSGRVTRLLVAEGLLLGVGGAMVGLAITAITLKTVVALSPADLPFRDAVRINLPVLAVTAALAVIAGLTAGLVPAVRVARQSLVLGKRSGGTARARLASNLLVLAQMTAAMVLVAGASLLIRSFTSALRVDPGLRTDGVLTSGITLPRARYDEARQHQFFRAVLDSLGGVPGIRAAAVGTLGPLQGAIPVDIALDPTSQPTGRVRLNGVSPGYMSLLGIPVLAGRAFEPHDDEDGERVMILSRLAATRLFPEGSPVGRTIYKDGEPWRVVGVVEDVRQEGLLEELAPVAYAPFHQYFLGAGTFVVVGPGEPAALANAFRQVIRRLDPVLAVDRIETLAAVIDESLSQPRFYAVTVGVFGTLALSLAVAGLYAVIAFAARRRVYEFGVRSALGARPRDNLWLVYRQGVVLSVIGVAAGGIVAFHATRVLRALLYATEPADPRLLALAAALTLVIALVACMVPALRAARVDPVIALKAE